MSRIVGRRSINPIHIKGLDIPADMTIVADVMSIHYDPEIWGPIDPNEFYPERFSPEQKRHPVAFLGFGLGPRNCIGLKFAYLEIKIALCLMLRHYEVLKSLNTCERLEFVEGIVRKPTNVIVSFKKRNL